MPGPKEQGYRQVETLRSKGQPQQLLMSDFGGQPLTPDLGLSTFDLTLATYA